MFPPLRDKKIHPSFVIQLYYVVSVYVGHYIIIEFSKPVLLIKIDAHVHTREEQRKRGGEQIRPARDRTIISIISYVVSVRTVPAD